jgi:tRNA1Val (adenine37-N6)-methyltransferase
MSKQIVLNDNERIDEVNESLKLIRQEHTLAFGTDAYLLFAFMRPAAKQTAVELGCGNGIISLLAATRDRFSHIFAIELQEQLASLSRRNVTLNGLDGHIDVLHADAREIRAASIGGEVGVVFANPPYMRAYSGFPSPYAAKQTARHETDGGIMEFSAAAARLLKHGGLFYSVYRPDRLPSLLAALDQSGLSPKRMIFVHDHQGAAPSMVLTEAKKGAAEGLQILPPLFLHESDADGNPKKELSPRAAEIYKNGSF